MSLTPSRRRLLTLPLLALCAAALPSFSIAQAAWPARPIRIVVAYPPGGLSDNIARALADKLAAQLGTPVVVENRAGAGGSIGMDVVAKAAPDGYTIGVLSDGPMIVNPALYPNNPYQTLRDFVPVAMVKAELTS